MVRVAAKPAERRALLPDAPAVDPAVHPNVGLLTRCSSGRASRGPPRLHIDVVDNPPGSRAPGSVLVSAEPSHTLGTTYRARAPSIATALALGRTADAAIAVELYRRANAGGLPDSLAQLVPAYLRPVPIDPFSGRELRYSKSATRYVVYSVGTNEKDDGGLKVDYPVWRSGAFQDRGAPPDLGVAIHVEPRRTQ